MPQGLAQAAFHGIGNLAHRDAGHDGDTRGHQDQCQEGVQLCDQDQGEQQQDRCRTAEYQYCHV
ncbi:hypothetical protein D3C87_2204530 [compost metagenome]